MEKKRRVKAGSIALYVLAVVVLCYGAYMIFQSYTYVASYYDYQGTSLTDNLGDVFQYIISQSYQYICFSIVFYVMGLLLQKMNDLHDFLPKEYLHPKELDEQEVDLSEAKRMEDDWKQDVDVQVVDEELEDSHTIYDQLADGTHDDQKEEIK